MVRMYCIVAFMSIFIWAQGINNLKPTQKDIIEAEDNTNIGIITIDTARDASDLFGVPTQMNVQGYLLYNNEPVNGAIPITFSIWDAVTGGNKLWGDEVDTVECNQGLFNFLIGSKIPINPWFFTGGSFRALQMVINGQVMPRIIITSVGWAFSAAKSDSSVLAYNSDQLDGYHGGVSGANIYPRTDASGKLNSSVIPPVSVSYADSAGGSSRIGGQTLSQLDSRYVNENQGNSITTSMILDGTIINSDIADWTIQLSKLNQSGATQGQVIKWNGYQWTPATDSSGPHNHFGDTWNGSADSAFVLKNNTSSTSNVYGFKNYLTASSSPNAYGISSTVINSRANGDAIGVSGYAQATNYGYVTGVEGHAFTTADDAEGVYGFSQNNSTDNNDRSCGVVGYASLANGSQGTVFGGHFTAAGETGTGPARGVFVNGRSAGAATSYGVYSTAENASSGTVYGGYFEAQNYGTGIKYGIYATAPTSPSGSYAGRFVGNFLVTGGTKSCGVKLKDGKYYHLYCQESPEVWFEDFGKGKLVNGKAVIQIDPMFAQSANTDIEYHVFLTPEDKPIVLAVANKTSLSFEVIAESSEDINFSYRIVAKRRGFENLRFEPVFGKTPEEIEMENKKFMEINKTKERERIK